MAAYCTVEDELATLRSLLHSAQETVEVWLEKETLRRGSTQSACSSARKKLELTQNEVKCLRIYERSLLVELDAFNTQVDGHNEVYQRLENRARMADEEYNHLIQSFKRQKEIFKTTVAANTNPVRRLHAMFANFDVADDSANAHLKRRNEDLREQVKCLANANKTLRAHVKLEEMDLDVLVPVIEGSQLASYTGNCSR